MRHYRHDDVPNVEGITELRLLYPILYFNSSTSRVLQRRQSENPALLIGTMNVNPVYTPLKDCTSTSPKLIQKRSVSHVDQTNGLLSAHGNNRSVRVFSVAEPSVGHGRSSLAEPLVSHGRSSLAEPSVSHCRSSSKQTLHINTVPRSSASNVSVDRKSPRPAGKCSPLITAKNERESVISRLAGVGLTDCDDMPKTKPPPPPKSSAGAMLHNGSSCDDTYLIDIQKRPLPVIESTAAVSPSSGNPGNEEVYYSTVRDTYQELAPSLIAHLREQEADIGGGGGGKCECGLYLDDAELPRGWTVHISGEPLTAGCVFFTGPDSQTAWNLPIQVSVELSTDQQDMIRRLLDDSQVALDRRSFLAAAGQRDSSFLMGQRESFVRNGLPAGPHDSNIRNDNRPTVGSDRPSRQGTDISGRTSASGHNGHSLSSSSSSDPVWFPETTDLLTNSGGHGSHVDLDRIIVNSSEEDFAATPAPL